MKKMMLAAIVGLMMWNAKAATPPQANYCTFDTSVYESYPAEVSCFPGPHEQIAHASSGETNGILCSVYKKKGSNQYDIFTLTGKIGSIIIPSYGTSNEILISQTFIDEDADWECIENYRNYPETFLHSVVLDADGTVLLSDTGSRSIRYAYDFQNTYVYRQVGDYSYKYWRFRTNVSSSSPNALSKTAGSFPHAMMAYGPTGDYRIRLAPAGGGKTSVQLFDMLGRNVFSKNIDNITSPVTFTIPENNVPQSPFIAKVKDEKGVSIKREIPVK
jgi:hypothetical protein